jgi:hypothetical protein
MIQGNTKTCQVLIVSTGFKIVPKFRSGESITLQALVGCNLAELNQEEIDGAIGVCILQ